MADESAALTSVSSLHGERLLAALAAADGFAVGRSLRSGRRDAAPSRPGSFQQLTLREAVARVRCDLQQLLSALSSAEAELFIPEVRILDEIAPRLLARDSAGRSREDLVVAETSCGCTDLVIDLRVRLLHALEGSSGVDLNALAALHDADLVLVTDSVTPTMVASLPEQIVAVLAGVDASTGARRDVGRTSHAAILARGRGLPLVYVTPDLLASIPDGAWLVVEATEAAASVCVEPSAPRLAAARRRLRSRERQRTRDDMDREPLAHLGVELRVNVASSRDEIPAGADGVGLVRTEMMFAGRLTAPSESEQLAALLLLGAKARGRPVVVRLFDAGGDKPLAWLGEASDPSRGIERLLAYPELLATQLRALARARDHADVRVLLPFVRTAAEVNAVRRLAAPTLQIGAMIESPDAVEAIERIASAADFLSIGTNDLTATTLGLERGVDVPQDHPRVLTLVRAVIAAAHASGRTVTVCGEMAGNEEGARIVIGLGADALSVAPAQLAIVRRALRRATREGCRVEAQAAIDNGMALAADR
jgi:phosphoenolpyruvate-protein kinase (PTS system EI component)